MKTFVFALVSLFIGVASAQEFSALQSPIEVIPDSGHHNTHIFVVEYANHSTNNPNYRCSQQTLNNILRSAEQSGISDCYKEGLSICELKTSRIVLDGYLGTPEGWSTYLGYGCLAEAVIHGRR